MTGKLKGRFILIALILYSGCDYFKTKYEEIPPDLPDEPRALAEASYDWTLQTLDSTAVPFSEFKGKGVFLNIWETWCVPCWLEMPKIETLYKKFASNPEVAFAVVSSEDFGTIRAFTDSSGWKLPFYRQSGVLPEVFQGEGFPRTFIIDRRGGIVHREYRTAKWDNESCVRFIEKVLAQ